MTYEEVLREMDCGKTVAKSGTPIKILIGGSPCTKWSIAQKNGREVLPEGIGWELFENYRIAKEKFQPDIFLYENNKSAAQPIKDEIYSALGGGKDSSVRLTHIDSALVSAQHRERFYVTNFGDIEQPEDRGILLRDVLESGKDLSCREKAYTLTASYGGAVAWNTLERNQRTMVAEPVFPLKSGKARCVTAGYANKGAAHILESYYSPNPSKQKWDSVAEPVAIPLNTTVNGKAKALRANCYKDGIRNLVGNDIDKRTAVAEPVEFEGIVPTKAVSCADGKVYTVYEVRDGQITIKGRRYPIKLQDGYYIIRKLTPTECERLQTMQDGYTSAVSNSQRYKALGNGWTAEVIIHILNHALKDVPRDKELVVLSMYDGIATGRYCLDKMGFTNVKYYAYEIDPYAQKIAMSNYPDIVQCGDAFQIRNF
jgi:DNA (cytosine-5)-methyltransferase 3A